MKPTPTEITIFATHKDGPVPVYRNVVLSVPSVGDKVFYRHNKRKHSQHVVSVAWEYNVDNPYVRARVELK
jgi:hypothetical protein